MNILHAALLGLFVFLCLLIICAVLLQTGKGGGLAGLGGGAADSAFGVHTANVLQKFTGVCVILFFLLVIILSHTQKGTSGSKNVMDDYKAPAKTEPTKDAAPSPMPLAPATPAPAPQNAPAAPAIPAPAN